MMQWLEISRSALRNNAQFLKKKFPQQKFWPCVKSNAYGHGIDKVVESMDDLVDGYTVVSSTEALELRQFTKKKIVVLNIVEPEEISQCTQQNIVLPLATIEQGELYSQQKVEVSVHLEFDSGMARTGFLWNSPQDMAQYIESLPSNIKISGIFSHYAASEVSVFTKHQHDSFAPFVHKAKEMLGNNLDVHIDKSASVWLTDETVHSTWRTAFRPGIITYGLSPSGFVPSELQPVLEWKTKIISVRRVQQGQPVGYGLTFIAPTDMMIATIPVGYVDGYDRSLSNKAHCLVRGQRCPVRGRICMNLSMIEVTPEAKVGDEVVLIGKQGNEFISAEELGRLADTTHYEIVSRLRASLTRILVQ